MVAYVITRYGSDEYGCDPYWDAVQVVIGEDGAEDATLARARERVTELQNADTTGVSYGVETPELPTV